MSKPITAPKPEPLLNSKQALVILGRELKPGGAPISLRSLHGYKKLGLPYIKGARNGYFESQLVQWAKNFRKGVWV